MVSKTTFALLIVVLGLVSVNALDSATLLSLGGGVGGAKEYPIADAEKLLSSSLKTEKVLKVHSATVQTVAGSKYKITADLEVDGKPTEKCLVTILEGIDKKTTDIECPAGYKKSF